MSSSPPRVGADIESQCGKCGRETWHVILAMVGPEIVKVQCKICDAQHKYKRPGGSAPRRGGGGGGGGERPKAAREKATDGPTVVSDLSRPVRPYRGDERYDVADRVQHPRFGTGVVELSEPGKITVYFPSGRRVLAQARVEAQLARRRPTPASEE